MNITIPDYILRDWNNSFARERLFNVVIKCTFLIVGIVGNITVLVIYKFRMKNERRERYFIPYLAVIDTLATVATSSMSITKSIHPVSFPSGHLCKALWYLLLSTTSTSAFYLLVICVIRYRKVCYLQRSEMDMRVKKTLLAGVAGLGFILAVPSIFLYGERQYHSMYEGRNVSGPTCSGLKMTGAALITRYIYFLIILLTSVGVMLAMVILYVRIGHVVYRSVAEEKQRRQQTLHPSLSTGLEPSYTSSASTNVPITKPKKAEGMSQVKRAKHNFTYMFLTILIVYVVSFTPSVVMIVALSARDQMTFWFSMKGAKLNALYFLSESYIINHVANPFIYLYFDMKFRNELVRICFYRK